MKPLYLVLPCYNEEKSLPALITRALDCAKKRNLTPEQFQLLLVENGSKDKSLQVMEQLKNSPDSPWLQIVPVNPNKGYGFGVWQGLKKIPQGVIAAWSHADEQCDPEDVFKGWEIINGKSPDSSSTTLVKGARNRRDLKDWIISRGFEFLASLIFLKPLHEINAQPKVFDSSLIEKIDNPPFDFAFDVYVLVKARQAGLKFIEIPVDFPARKHGQSNWAATFQSKVRNIAKVLRYMILFRLGKT